MLEFGHIVYEIVVWLFLLYSAAVFIIYTWIGLYAYGAVFRYKHDNSFTDYGIIATNPNAPTFSLIAPAFNEGMTIVENVRSLLSLYYHNLEIIIVNDGSRDDSMLKLIEAYALEQVSFFVQGDIETKPIRGIYKSKNPAFKKLVVVDKENGGKADALNVGVNISSGDYIVCIDVDCILEQDAILRLAKPFLEQTDKRVIACGGVIRLANNCKVVNGTVVDVNLPKTWIGRTQALEYIRAFILGRMAWSRASGLILISGAFGAFDRQIVLACGGYDRNTVGEDMELVVRMRRYMEEEKLPYEVVNIPDPLCWTEVPESKDVLRKQRNRWMRGTMETLWKHRKLLFNPKYGRLGMISMPYWFFFEFLGPLVEFSGYVVFLIFFILGIINWPFFFALFALVLASGILYSIYAILVDLVSHQVYSKKRDLSTLITTAVLEPFYFHPLVVKAAVQGVADYFRKKHSWGEMTRQGFQQRNANEPVWKYIRNQFSFALQLLGPSLLVFFTLYMFSIAVEWWWYHSRFVQLAETHAGRHLFIDNLLFVFQSIAVLGVLYLLVQFVSRFWAKLMLVVSLSFIIVMQFILFLYFGESRNLLGADVFYYSSDEMKQILDASGMLNLTNIALLLLLIVAAWTPLWLVNKRPFKNAYPSMILIGFGLLSFFISPALYSDGKLERDEFANNASRSKWRYFFDSNLSDYVNEHPGVLAYLSKREESSTEINVKYPFLKNEDTRDFLGTYLEKSERAPNLVVLIIEGLGHAYSSDNGYIGNFTPFIDSLKSHSLYWENNISSSGRTFSVLPTLTGSLPFGMHGFLEQDSLPANFNLFNILQANGFKTGFFYGGHSNFDFMKKFMLFNRIDALVDQDAFGPPYKKLPEKSGESWGYEDQAVFSKLLEVQHIAEQPYFHVLLTLSTHNPFLINNAGHYEQLFDQRLAALHLSGERKKWALENRKQLISVLNLDDAMRQFFTAYSKRPDFANTLFLITGDHAMPEVPLQSKIDRYHVPLLLYSPLLKTSHNFRHIVSHFDVAPSILAYYRENYGLNTPDQVAWIGRGLDKGISAEGDGIAMMQSKNQLIDFLLGNYHFSEGQLYRLDGKLNAELADEPAVLESLSRKFELFKRKNKLFYTEKQLLPDSVFISYFNKLRKP
ncbi:sulfatase-like hydrolase/transferase [Sphingobacterium thalpophilum]|uniref:Poly-beta-1,6-N-acetyl-D-glucosamine synthase n=1 Tax=Sphingobacterium thalpophilum TaxID=259 RepID=A0A4U9W3X5_9SPHI|nr:MULTISPECIES: sulfatase-like hydrolase/transferase [Sphingobacterium]MCW8311470.1 glycosyltransferase [Sphingobacterium sp. InxBP1]VTR53384.1 Poly-beta-1,6-N-acetyl-D-glucosamine synthase [Sphingobacterium thalpophilum]